MLIRRALAVAASFTACTLVTATSTARNPLKAVGVARNPDILTQNHRVTAVSTFDVAFDFSGTRIRLSLEPNYDIIAEGAVVQYMGADGTITKEEPINRLEHKVFKGKTWIKRWNRWDNAGWARITIRRDGIHPLFEGAFTVNHDHHHIQLSSNYKQTKHDMDPDVDLRDDEFMVVFRDSDISPDHEHAELRKRSGGELGCRSDDLGFNRMPDHPVYTGMVKRDDDIWNADGMSLIDKRESGGDIPSGGGNSAGVNLVSTIGNTNGCPSTRKVALVGVATDCTYTGSFNSSESARQNVINQINAASNLYESTFNISLGLANLFVTDAACPSSVQSSTQWNQPCTNNLNIQDRLNLFSQWRGQQKDSNSHWTLLSTCNTGSAVGLAWLGQACTQGSQANNSTDGGSSETVAGANVVVRTSTEWQVIAHETGHTFGAVHDCTSDACKDANYVNSQQCCQLSASTCDAGQRYIMNPSTAQGITNFSPCSIGNICSAMLRNSVKTTCLTNNKGVATISGQQCGNGIVEEGEDCDCGGEEGCGDNACCDPKTCKFKSGAVCDDSNEDCCKDCKLASSSVVCRPSTGQCDPEEKCTGDSPYCPEDKTQPDGTDCGNNLKCASGQCTSRDQQCKTVMGSYTKGNETYACDDSNCMLSCGSPEFGANVCYGLRQNFLDGTPCIGGGHCKNGQCADSSAGKEIKSWINNHKSLVIGIASAIGGLIVLSILGCCYRCFKRRRTQKLYANNPAYRIPVAPPQYNGPGQRGARLSRAPPRALIPGGGPPLGPQMAERGNGWQGGHDIPQPPPMYSRAGPRYA